MMGGLTQQLLQDGAFDINDFPPPKEEPLTEEQRLEMEQLQEQLSEIKRVDVWPPGTPVRVVNVTSQPELNGRLGRVTKYVADKARYGILLKYGQTWSKQSISLKKSALLPITSLDAIQAALSCVSDQGWRDGSTLALCWCCYW